MNTSPSNIAETASASSLGPDPEPLGSERFARLMSRPAERGVTAHSQPATVALADGARRHLPTPRCVSSEPALVAPYVTDGDRLLRVVSHATLGSELVVVLEDCDTLEVEFKAWRELAGSLRAVPA